MRRIYIFTLLLVTFASYANVFQFFAGISYSNPAELFKVKTNEVILGGTGFNLNGHFTGSALNFNTFNYDYGSSTTQDANLLPYGRIATRINDKLVFGVDITEPFNSNLYWGSTEVTRYASTETLMTDVDVSPRFSLNLTPKTYVGAGLNFNFLKNNETNWMLPTGPTTYDKLYNRSSSFGLGYDLGWYYLINQTNFLSVSFYSPVKHETRGESIFHGNISNDLAFTFSFPSTTNINYVHIFSPQWLVSLQTFRTDWSVNQFAPYLNTAATPPLARDYIFPVKYKASWAFNAAARRQVSETLGLTFIGLVDYGPERDNLRPVNFPSDTIYFLALATDYHLTKSTSLELLYGHGFSKTLIQNKIAVNNSEMPFTTGRVRINVDVVDLKIKIQM